MMELERSTQENILQAGKREFLEKGFREASLRNIVKSAGVTTGAFYGYYKSKEDLFDALVSEAYATLMARFNQAQTEFAALPSTEQPEYLGDISGDCMIWMTGYIYENFDAFKLLLCCADGTRYEQFIHSLVEIEAGATARFLSVLRGLGYTVRHMDPQLEHILISGFFSGFFEIVVHDMPLERAYDYVRELRDFYLAGWRKIIGL